jgi:hypothetical protein
MAVRIKSKVQPVLTPEFRVSYPSVFEARAAMDGAPLMYSLTMLFRTVADPKHPEEKVVDIGKLKQNVVEVLTEQFGPDKTKWPKFGVGPGLVRLPFRNGAEPGYVEKAGYGPGVVFVRASSGVKFAKPQVVDGNVNPILSPNEFYGGCYAQAMVKAHWYDNSGNRGVSFYLGNVQKIRDGIPFGGATKPEDDFDKIALPAGAAGEEGAGDPLGDLGA